MKRTLTGVIAASVVVGTMIPIAFASTSNPQWFKMKISVDNSTLSNPYGVVQSDGSNLTTYVPIYYVNEALKQVGYEVSWNGTTKTWAFTTSGTKPSFPNASIGTGTTSITVNGTTIKKMNTMVNRDPEGGANTTYIPIFYVTPLFTALNASANWDGTSHAWTITSAGGTATNPSGSDAGTSGTLTAPTVQLQQTNATSNIKVSSAESGSILTLYDASGSKVVATVASSDGTATFYHVSVGSYYVVETANGETSGNSNLVTISNTTPPPTAPTIFSGSSNGVWYISVNNAVSNSQITLFDTNGNQISTATSDEYGVATFPNVVPGSYYVVESANGNSIQSNAISVNSSGTSTPSSPLATPNLSLVQNGTSSLTVTGVSANAQVTLYNTNGNVYAANSANASGIATFNNVAVGTYYAIQSVNGQQSAASNSVTVNSVNLSAPYLSVSQVNGAGTGTSTATITATNASANAVVTLYTSNGQFYTSGTANSAGVVTFYNVNSGSYYAIQTYNGGQSTASNYVTVNSANSLATPSLSVSQNNGSNGNIGTGTISVSGISASATVTLYTTNGQTYSSITASSAGNVAFYNVPSGSYYAFQYLNGLQSGESNIVTVNTAANSNLSVPTIAVSLSNGGRNIVISNVSANATVTLYTTNGTVYATSTANSSGSITFYNVASGSYYAKQTWGGTQSAASGNAMLS
jgi:hypothetical protein